MSTQPFMHLYVGDYLADTRHLTTEQHGAYLLILITMWKAGAKLPNDPAKLARIAGVSLRRWHLVWPEIEAFFTTDEGGFLTQGRLGKDYQKAISKRELRSALGRLGGNAKALKENEVGLAKATVLPWHSSKPEPAKKEKEDSMRAAAAATPKPQASKGTRVSADWLLPRAWSEWAVETTGLDPCGGRLAADWFRAPAPAAAAQGVRRA